MDRCQPVFTMYEMSAYTFDPIWDFLWGIEGDDSPCRYQWGAQECIEEPCPEFPVTICDGWKLQHSYSLYAPGFPDTYRFSTIESRDEFQKMNPVYAGWLPYEEGERCGSAVEVYGYDERRTFLDLCGTRDY